MSRPMNYQQSASDSVGTSLLNGISQIFGIDSIPNEILRTIYSCIAGIYEEEKIDENISDSFLFYFSKWLNNYSKEYLLPVHGKFLKGKDVNILKFRQILLLKGSVVLKVKKTGAHYVLLTGMDADYFYIFDPDYSSSDIDSKLEGVDVVLGNNIQFNRKVKIDLLLSVQNEKYTMGSVDGRSALLLWRSDELPEREYK